MICNVSLKAIKSLKFGILVGIYKLQNIYFKKFSSRENNNFNWQNVSKSIYNMYLKWHSEFFKCCKKIGKKYSKYFKIVWKSTKNVKNI